MSLLALFLIVTYLLSCRLPCIDIIVTVNFSNVIIFSLNYMKGIPDYFSSVKDNNCIWHVISINSFFACENYQGNQNAQLLQEPWSLYIFLKEPF